MTVRVRMAPSPTGFIHIGNLRTAIYNFLFAKKQDGTVVLRFEDTDRTRYVPGAMEAFCRTLKGMDLIPDEGAFIDEAGNLFERGPFGPYIQTKRQEKHRAYAQELMEKGFAYPCFCSEQRLEDMRARQREAGLPTKYDGTCRKIPKEEAAERMKSEPHVIRLAAPSEGSIAFADAIRGTISYQWKEMDDQVIIKSDGMATYHLAAVADDHDMEITHVIRGEEWLSSTPKHLFIYRSLGWEPPQFAHVPLLLNADRSKLSKRQNDVNAESYLEKGYLPQALVNFLALQGWNPSGDREIYGFDELASAFDLSKINKGGAVVNFEKLDWLNAHYLKQLSDEAFFEYAKDGLAAAAAEDADLRRRVAALVRDRISKKADIPAAAAEFLVPSDAADASLVRWKEQAAEDAAERLNAVREALLSVPDADWSDSAALEAAIKNVIAARGWGNGEVLWPLRVALSGKKQSPSPFELLFAFGKSASLDRIGQSIASLETSDRG